MANISKRVRDALRLRLESAWSAKLTSVLAGYDLPADDTARLAAIDWTGAVVRQVFLGQVDPALIEYSNAIVRPIVLLSVTGANHDGREKFRLFSGSVQAQLDFVWTWRQASALPDFEQYLDAIEDTLVEVLHDRAWVANIGSGISYAGEMDLARSPVQMGGEHWTQTLTVRMRFGVDV